ncbi:MAG: hypothetical protein NT002_03450 [candidate division Zixibacteria bacterium]|nr:hypothetical protein [candidate division Zixibacteria bacterium]
MKKIDTISKFLIFLDFLSILALIFFVWIILGNWTAEPNGIIGLSQSGRAPLGKGYAILFFIISLNGNILLILLSSFSDRNWKGRTIYERLMGRKDNRDIITRQFHRLFLTVGKTGITWAFAVTSWQLMLLSRSAGNPFLGTLLVAIIIATVLLWIAAVVHYIVRKAHP